MIIKIPIKNLDIEGDGCHLLVKAAFNSKHKGFLIIDTGASKSVFDMKQLENIIEIIPHEPETIKSSGISQGFLENKMGLLKKIKIGELTLTDYPVVLLDLSHINKLYEDFFNKPIWGLLGGDFLKQYQAKINYKNNSLILDIPKHPIKKNLRRKK